MADNQVGLLLGVAKLFHRYRNPPNTEFDQQAWLNGIRRRFAAFPPSFGEDQEPDWHAKHAPRRNEHKWLFDDPEFLDERQTWAENPDEWRGVHILGGGGQGVVGLFEHKSGKRVAVKRSTSEKKQSILMEARMMRAIGSGNPTPQHVVRLVHEPPELTGPYGDFPDINHYKDRNWEELEALGEKAIDTIVMEHCEHLDLQRRLVRQKRIGCGILESNLWSIFNCLIQAITVLDRGHDDPTMKKPKSWKYRPIVHFDIKPHNIFLAQNDGEHPQYVYKLADFGLAVEMNGLIDESWKRKFRRRGTLGWLVPEQFVSKWDHNDWDITGVAGRFGTPTNVWAMGVIMYQLCTLGAPPVPVSFRPKKNPLSPRIIGRTYGRGLNNTPYSDELKVAIWECLYEMTGLRPSLEDLMDTIVNGYSVALDAERAGTGPVKLNGLPDDDYLGQETEVSVVSTAWGGKPPAAGTKEAPIIVSGSSSSPKEEPDDQEESGFETATGLRSFDEPSDEGVPQEKEMGAFPLAQQAQALGDEEPDHAGDDEKLNQNRKRGRHDNSEDDTNAPQRQRRKE